MTPVKRLSGLLLIVRRSLAQHALSTVITALSVALASGLVMSVTAVHQQAVEAFTGSPVGFDAVLGGRGSPLQLVLNSVYHLESSTDTVPWGAYSALRKDPRVALAIPYAVGDSYRGFRVVGTTEELFTKHEDREGRRMALLGGGRIFDPRQREAVLGSTVASKTRLKVGDRFHPSHGVLEDPGAQHEEEYVVVGVTAPTGSPADAVCWIPIEGFFHTRGHALRGAGKEFQAREGEEIPEEHKEVSAVMLMLRGPKAGYSLDEEVNRLGKSQTLAWPIGRVMAEFFERFGWMSRVLGLVSLLVVIVAAGAILASLYNTMNERRREFAILRALGAKRRTVFSAIVLESTAIAAIGTLGGYVVYAVIAAAAAAILREQTGVFLDPLRFHPVLAWTPAGMAALGALAGVVPAMKAYATDVASTLSSAS
jgi:putative ABC transport system permease protein